MLLVHKDIPHMPLTELDNDSESVWVKLFVNKKTLIPPIKKPRRKVYRYQKGDYGSMRAETLKFAKETSERH